MLLELSTPIVLRAEPPITAICFSPQGDRLLVASQRGLRSYQPSGALPVQSDLGESLGRLPPAIHGLQFSPEGHRLLVSGGIPAERGSVVLIDWPGQSQIWRKAVGEDVIYGSDWSPDGRSIATASFDGVCRILHAEAGRTEQSLLGHSAGLTAVTWIERERLVTASRDATLRLWNASTGQLERTFNNHAGPVTGVMSKPSTATERPAALPTAASIGDDRTVRFWQPTIGRLMRFYRFDSARPVCAAWTPDDELLAVGTTAGQVVLVDPLSAAIRATFVVADPHAGIWVTALAVQPDGKAIAAGSSTGNVEWIELTKELLRYRSAD